MGEISALIAAFLWAVSSLFFSFSGKQIGASLLNLVRLSFAFVFLVITHTILFGSPIPLEASFQQWSWLGLSSLIGLVIGDYFLFQSFIMVGPRLGMLVMAISPVISSLLAWVFLGEVLSLLQIFGIILTIGGISIVVLDRNDSQNTDYRDHNKWLGILFAIGAATGQAVGLIFAKKGLPPDFSALSGVVIRVMVASIFVWIQALVRKQIKPGIQILRKNIKAIKSAFVAAIIGPYIGVWLSLVAVQFAKVGIASTLMALTPVFHLPLGSILKEKITIQSVLGTIIAISGVAILFL